MRFSYKMVVIILLALMVTILIQCNSEPGKPAILTSPVTFTEADVTKGKILAAGYCQSCHKLPDPALLDKETWRSHVLPVMGLYLGIQPAALVNNMSRSPQDDLNYMPDSAMMDTVKWKQIVAYYTAKAPTHLPTPNRPLPLHQLPFFKIQPTAAEWYSTISTASYVKIDTSVSPHRLIVNDGISNRLTVLNDKVQKLKSYTLDGAIVDMQFQKNKAVFVTTIGRDLWANNFKNGNVKEITIDNNGDIKPQSQPLFAHLGRPVSVNIADFNGDGRMDYLIAQFGKMAGRLSWMENRGRDFKEHIIRQKPGCIKTVIDYNNKSKGPDIWTLFAQGDEGIFLYKNTGNGNFTEKQVLSFPPSYGSSSFELVDFNSDGFKDIIYTCGDNGDYSQILKPYHGLYIYLNDGKNNFTQKYFYPINGCYKAIARDFDGDGDLDIATISCFPAAATPWEAFIYFENKGDFKFQTYTLPLNTPFQKGLTMDAADIDDDGKTDLLLGNGFYNSDKNNHTTQPLFIVLKNITSPGAKVTKNK
ncbi:VCBS repeat-containing protein [Mucilaginibacter sp. UR6-11]|uniref:FG-GAP repeat domain-containing protein n=1 Tax=Mucilaginibacter sp. UR6-11 TaxID=1435644 RepID=UPI001E57EA30|nr:VCBS repeat-containing protein [Mucilaginibacter sp. UR6-11]MCC8425463.1 VCBS repeat-containing protein [Mucilaginibacter sp. UR6-11]